MAPTPRSPLFSFSPDLDRSEGVQKAPAEHPGGAAPVAGITMITKRHDVSRVDRVISGFRQELIRGQKSTQVRASTAFLTKSRFSLLRRLLQVTVISVNGPYAYTCKYLRTSY